MYINYVVYRCCFAKKKISQLRSKLGGGGGVVSNLAVKDFQHPA